MRKTNMLTKVENISELLSFNGNNHFVSYCQRVIYLWLAEILLLYDICVL